MTTKVECEREAQLADYTKRVAVRDESLDRLAERIDFSSPFWRDTHEGKRWNQLIQLACNDEQELGL